MGHEDRERNFEQALARHLRAQEAREPEGAADGCPDATTLAAFHERMLSSEEMNFAKAHVAACSRCQEILANLEATDDIEVRDEESVAASRASVLSTGGLYVDYAARQSTVPAMATAARPASSMNAPRAINTGRRATWKWVAPAGALAAGLLVWIVARESKPLSMTPASKIEVAREQPDARYTNDQLAATPMNNSPEIAKRLDDAQKSETKKPEFGGRNAPEESRDSRGKASGGIVGGAKPDGYTSALKRESQSDALRGLAQRKANADLASNLERQNNEPLQSAAAPPAPATPPVSGDKKNQSSPASAAANSGDRTVAGASGESGKDGKSLNKQKLEGGVESSTAARAEAGAPSSAAGPKAAAKKSVDSLPVQGRNAAEGAEKKEADESVAVTTQAEVTSEYGRVSALQNGKTGEAIVPAPGGTVIWRLRPKGKIERSVDSGVSWSRQSSGVNVELVAGSAPSDAVCWVVGRAGTILRTTDGGGHWSRVVSPIAGNVGGIRAVDAMHATIFGASGDSKSGGFATSDGGATWAPAVE